LREQISFTNCATVGAVLLSTAVRRELGGEIAQASRELTQPLDES